MSKDIKKRTKKRRKIEARLNHVAIVTKGANDKEFFLFKRADGKGKVAVEKEAIEELKKLKPNNMTKSELRNIVQELIEKNIALETLKGEGDELNNETEKVSGGNEDVSKEQKKKLRKEDEDEEEEGEKTEDKEDEKEDEVEDDKDDEKDEDEKDEVEEEEKEEVEEKKPAKKKKKPVKVEEDEEVTGQSQVLLSKPDYDKLINRIAGVEDTLLALEGLITGGKDDDKK